MASARIGRDIICVECPAIYSEAEITAHRGDEAKPLDQVLSAERREPGKWGRMVKRLSGRDAAPGRGAFPTAELQAKLNDNLGRLQDWTFTCPNGHQVDGNRGLQLPIAVVGASGSSKTHFLPGLIWETGLKRALGQLGVSLRQGTFTSSAPLDYSVAQVYQHRKVLPATPPDRVTGPFGYRLDIRTVTGVNRHSLLLFDVGGEALSSIVRIKEQAAFVLLCQAIVVLIDPHELMSTQFDPPEQMTTEHQRVIAAARVRDGINRVVDALEELWGRPIRDIPVAVCFVVAKADSVDWMFDWCGETAQVVGGVAAGGELHELLVQSSDRVRAQFEDNGGALIVEEIAERFDQDRVRFVAASATSEMPDQTGESGVWTEPTPSGISLSLLHLLDMLSKLDRVREDEAS